MLMARAEDARSAWQGGGEQIDGLGRVPHEDRDLILASPDELENGAPGARHRGGRHLRHTSGAALDAPVPREKGRDGIDYALHRRGAGRMVEQQRPPHAAVQAIEPR